MGHSMKLPSASCDATATPRAACRTSGNRHVAEATGVADVPEIALLHDDVACLLPVLACGLAHRLPLSSSPGLCPAPFLCLHAITGGRPRASTCAIPPQNGSSQNRAVLLDSVLVAFVASEIPCASPDWLYPSRQGGTPSLVAAPHPMNNPKW
jgi:hypothetical protein